MKGLLRGALLVAALLAVFGCAKAKDEAPVEGKHAPDFTLNDLSGRPVRLSSLKGKVVLVNFWATWCPPCREEIPSMMRLNQAMQGKPFELLAISVDEGGKEAVASFFAKSGYNLPALLDTDTQVSKLYGTTGVPETFVVSKNGVILKKVVGGLEWSSPEVIAALERFMQEK